MIKKICVIFCLFILFESCGKKGDPEYNENKSKVFNTKIKVVL